MDGVMVIWGPGEPYMVNKNMKKLKSARSNISNTCSRFSTGLWFNGRAESLNEFDFDHRLKEDFWKVIILIFNFHGCINSVLVGGEAETLLLEEDPE